MPKIVVRIDPGITHEVIRRGIILPPVIEPGAKNLRTGMVYPGNTGPQAAIAAAQTGDIIEVVPEVYTGFACNVPRSITLRSSAVGEKFVLDIGNGQYRGLELGVGVNLTLEDCELRNNKQEYSNAAGIWPTGGAYTLTIRRCLFSELNNGIMIGDHRQAHVLIEDSIFEDCGDYNGYSHNIYIGPVASLTMRRVVSRMSKNRADYGTEPWRVSWGHLVKSRAQRTVIEDCDLLQLGGEGNRCLDLPNGGDVTVVRTRMTLNTNIQNGGGGQMVSFGVEEAVNPVGLMTHRFDMQDCDLVNNGGPLKQFIWVMTNAQGVPAPSWNVRSNRFVGFTVPRAKQTTGAEGAIYEPDATLNTFDGVVVQPPPPPAGATVSNGVWKPWRGFDGTITEASWSDLPVGVAVEWDGTALESQLAPPYLAAGTFRDFGVSGIVDHFDGWSGAAFDETTGRFFCFGGGHAGSSNNMLSCFDSRSGKWSVAIPPTAIEAMPATYARTGLGGYTQVNYPDGMVADSFVPTQTPPGDGKPVAMHTYGGLLYVNGEVVKLRGGIGQTNEPGSRYWHADTIGKAWNKGGTMARSAAGIEQNAICHNGIVYWGMEGGQTGDNQYWTVTKYDVAQRKEIGTFGLQSTRGIAFGAWAGVFNCALPNGKWAVGVSSGYAGANGVVVIDLASGRTESETAWTGELVPGTYYDSTTLGAVWVPEWNRILLLDSWRRRWIEFDPATGVGVIARVQGGSPPCVNGVYGRLRYWPQRKVIILHSRTMQNAVIIRTG